MLISGLLTMPILKLSPARAFAAYLKTYDLGWLEVAVTGSDTSSNALFGTLLVAAAKDVGPSELLLASANTAGASWARRSRH